MYRKQRTRAGMLMSLGVLGLSTATAQFSLTGQLRTRTELRDGFGTLNPKNSKAAFFTSQRARLNFGYSRDRINFTFSLQDVRIWGQDASTINNADGSRLMVHEANSEIILFNTQDTSIKAKSIEFLSLKIGRQTLVYDDARLLGDLDWLQQARRHDAAVLKAKHKGWQIDLGAAFNQNTEAFGYTGTRYIPGNTPAYVTNSNGVLVATPAGLLPLAPNGSLTANSTKTGAPVLANPISTNGLNQAYKAMQFVHLSRKVGQIKLSGLLFKDDFSRYRLDSAEAGGGWVYGRRYDVTGVNKRITYGMMASGIIGKGTSLNKFWSAAAYFQNGKDRDGKSLKAAHYTASLTLQKGRFSVSPGYDYLSGNSTATPANKNHRFDPLYGTPHKYWGFMDYYYVGTGSPAGGLKNAYIKTKYTARDFFITIDAHHFSLAQKATFNGKAMPNNMGYEFDLAANYSLNPFTTIEAGYAFMLANNTTEFVKKGTTNTTNQLPQWAFLMINIRPDFLLKKHNKE